MARACESNEIDVLGDGTQCETAKFLITTTELVADTTFAFYMSAQGTFYVDWGDGTVDTITRNDTTITLYDHTYTTDGRKSIRFSGLATGYSTQAHASAIRFGHYTSDASTPTLIEAIDGSISAIFPTLGTANDKQPCFYSFVARSNIKTIPENLFANVIYVYNLLFARTFSGCSNLSGYIPASTFAGLIANGSPTVTDMWRETFDNTQLATSCPAGTVRFITGYEEYWNGKVSCVDESLVCGVGEYLPAHWYECKTCPENHYCAGGTYPYSEILTQGMTACGVGLFAPAGMWEAAQCGRILHIGDGFVYLRATKKTTPALHLDLDHDGIADYFGNMTTMDVPMSHGTQRKLKVRYNNTTYSIYEDSVDLGAQ